MGEAYLDWAPKLGYKYSVFNLVYETNVASCRIWDALGFKRIGRVPGCGNLKSYPDRLVDAIIYGRELSADAADGTNAELVSEERFDKIKFYLKHGRYPDGAGRAEKSRLRSAALHYTLLDNDVLMHKDKEVIADPARQYEIARQVHALEQQHAGINKTTATIAERYHWRGIKDTVSDVIKACAVCDDGPRTNGYIPSAITPNPMSISDPMPLPPVPVVPSMPGIATLIDPQQGLTPSYAMQGGDSLASTQSRLQQPVEPNILQLRPSVEGAEWIMNTPESFTYETIDQQLPGHPQTCRNNATVYGPSRPIFSDTQYNSATSFSSTRTDMNIDENSLPQPHEDNNANHHEEQERSSLSDRDFEMLLTQELQQSVNVRTNPD